VAVLRTWQPELPSGAVVVAVCGHPLGRSERKSATGASRSSARRQHDRLDGTGSQALEDELFGVEVQLALNQRTLVDACVRYSD
jgi:hypothetical protein